jgi:tudor domain-containing protein 2
MLFSDDYETVYVSAVEHPGHFWVQHINSDSLKYEKLIQDMASYYSTDDGQIKVASPDDSSAQEQQVAAKAEDLQEGDLIAAPFEGETGVYRARVLEVFDNNTLDVYFIDYGDSEILDARKVTKLK